MYRLRITLSLWQVLGWIPGLFTLDTVSPSARYSCDVSTELHCLGAKPRKLAPLLDTRFGVISRVFYFIYFLLFKFFFLFISEDFILFKFLSYSAPKIATEGTFHLVFLKQ